MKTLSRRQSQAFPKRRRPRRVLLGVAGILVLSSLLMVADVHSYRRLICTRTADAPVRPVAIVFGAAGTILEDRVTTGVELYKAGKVQKLLMTGDNSRMDYDEPGEMKREAVSQGVPSRDIVCDDAGFRTYDSLYRAKAIFGVRSAFLVTQRYHLPRALFIGRSLGLDVSGVDAAKRDYAGQAGFDLREIAADEVAWIQCRLIHPRPKFLGKPEPLFVSKSERPNMALDLHDPAARRHFYIQIAKKRVRPGSGSGPETLWARTWRRPVFDLRTITAVPFVVIGGVATRLYAPERVTDDLDILIETKNAETLSVDLVGGGCQKIGSLSIGGSHWRLPDGMALDVLEEDTPWAAEAIANPASAPNGLPVISLPYLVLMKMQAGRAIDIGDLSRVLGAADEATLTETRRVMQNELLDGVEDLEGLIYLGRLEYGQTIRE